MPKCAPPVCVGGFRVQCPWTRISRNFGGPRDRPFCQSFVVVPNTHFEGWFGFRRTAAGSPFKTRSAWLPTFLHRHRCVLEGEGGRRDIRKASCDCVCDVPLFDPSRKRSLVSAAEQITSLDRYGLLNCSGAEELITVECGAPLD